MDGKTDELIDKYQTNRKLSVEFDTPVSLNLQDGNYLFRGYALQEGLTLPKSADRE